MMLEGSRGTALHREPLALRPLVVRAGTQVAFLFGGLHEGERDRRGGW